MAYRASVLKSIQTGSITLGTNVSVTATITAVTVANAFVLWAGSNASDNGAKGDFCYLTLTNSTTVTAARNANAGAGNIVNFTVLEFYGNVLKTNQDFSVTIGPAASSGTATITAVTTANTMLVPRGLNYDTNILMTAISDLFCKFVLTNTTTVTVSRGNTTNTVIAYGTAVEFK